MSETVQIGSSVRKFKFNELAKSGGDGIAAIVENYGVVYVTSVTRDGCSGCTEQKPMFEELARKVTGENQARTVFNNIHVSYDKSAQAESEQAKKTFRHIAYPTYMIHLKSRFGILEAYRAVYPKMEDIEKQITETFETADFYREDAEKHA